MRIKVAMTAWRKPLFFIADRFAYGSIRVDKYDFFPPLFLQVHHKNIPILVTLWFTPVLSVAVEFSFRATEVSSVSSTLIF